MKVKSESEVAQLSLTLRDPMGCSLPGFSVHGIFQARVLEWGAIAFSEAHVYKYVYVCVGGHESGTTLSLRSWKWLHNWAAEHMYVSVCMCLGPPYVHMCVSGITLYMCVCVCVCLGLAAWAGRAVCPASKKSFGCLISSP